MNSPYTIVRNGETDSGEHDRAIYVDVECLRTSVSDPSTTCKWDSNLTATVATGAMVLYVITDDTVWANVPIVPSCTEATRGAILREPDMAAASQEAFAEIWDNDEDAVYDRWRELYGV